MFEFLHTFGYTAIAGSNESKQILPSPALLALSSAPSALSAG